MQCTATGLIGVLEECAPSHGMIYVLLSIDDIPFPYGYLDPRERADRILEQQWRWRRNKRRQKELQRQTMSRPSPSMYHTTRSRFFGLCCISAKRPYSFKVIPKLDGIDICQTIKEKAGDWQR
ncbi:hypothetical protein KC315_g5 [Hortaea werneckii]|nr:hypothetical protein KC315_g5 [Hortaea werneckii]